MLRRSPTLWAFLCEVYLPLHPGVSAGYRVQLETTVRLIERWHGGPLRLKDLTASLADVVSGKLCRGGQQAAAGHRVVPTVEPQ